MTKLEQVEGEGKKLYRVGIVQQTVSMKQVFASDPEEAGRLIVEGHGVNVGIEGPVSMGIITMETGLGQYKQGAFLKAFNSTMANMLKDKPPADTPRIIVPSIVPPKDIVPGR